MALGDDDPIVIATSRKNVEVYLVLDSHHVSGRILSGQRHAFSLLNPQRWKVITSTVFWAGEPGNMQSSFDANWVQNAPYQNPFYVALPYSDIDNHHTRPEARSVIPWFSRSFIRDGQSVCKDRWVAIRHENKVCFAQWEDVEPFQTDHWQCVFGNQRPRLNKIRMPASTRRETSVRSQQYPGARTFV